MKPHFRFGVASPVTSVAGAILFLLGWVEARAQTVFRPTPTHQDVGVSARPLLTWSYSDAMDDLNLLPNGGFEEGTNGWEFDSAGVVNKVGFRASFEGTNALSGRGQWVARALTLPDEPWGLRLSYATLGFLADPTLTVELLDNPGEPQLLPSAASLMPSWRIYGADLTAYAGQRVRLTWNFPSSDLVPWGFDDVRLTAVPRDTEFEIWLATWRDGPFKLLGRTRQPSWPLRFLQSSQTYYWRVDTFRGSEIVAGPVWQFETRRSLGLSQVLMDPVPAVACEQLPLILGLQLADESGFSGLGQNNARSVGTEIEAYGDGASPPAIVVTELSLNDDAAEFQNVSGETLDLSGWLVDLLVADGGSGNTNAHRKVIPSSSVLAPGGLFRVRRGSNGGWPDLTFDNFSPRWSNNQRAAVVLRNPAGDVEDCVFYSKTMTQQSSDGRVGQTRAVTTAHWPGLPLTGTIPAGWTVQRTGERDRNSADDWGFAPASPMAGNHELSSPFVPGYGMVPIDSPTNRVSTDRNGYFTVPVQFSGPASNVVLTATVFLSRLTSERISGRTLPFAIAPEVCLSMEIPVPLAESAGTLPKALRVQIPSPRETNVIVSLQLPAGPAEGVTIPSEVVIAAGATEATADLSVSDNSELTGPRSLALTASAAGYAPVQTTLVVEDDELATLRLVLPTSVRESEQLGGTLFVNPAPTRAIFIRLVSSDTARLQLSTAGGGSESGVIVEAGSTEAGFHFATPNNRRLEGHTNVLVRAEFANWTPDQVVVEIADDETNSLSLLSSWVESISEGTDRQLTIALGGLVPQEVPVTVTVDPPGRVVVVGSPKVSANESSSTVWISAVDDTQTNGLAEVRIRASAPGWVDAVLTTRVFDNDPARFVVRLPLGPMIVGQAFEFWVMPQAIDGHPIPDEWRLIPTPSVSLVGPDRLPFPAINEVVHASAHETLARITPFAAGVGARIRAEADALRGESTSFAVWAAAPRAGLVAMTFHQARNQLFVVDRAPELPLGVIDLNTGIRSATIPPLFNARQVALADADRTLFVGWQGGLELARVNTANLVVEETWPLGKSTSGEPLSLSHFLPLPGRPDSLLVARGTSRSLELVVFDGTNARPVVSSLSVHPVLGAPRALSLVAGLHSGQGFAISEGTVEEFHITEEGVRMVPQLWMMDLGFDRSARPGDSVFSQGLVLSGQVELLDPSLAGRAGGNLPNFGANSLAVDPRTGRLAWFHGRDQPEFRILDPLTLKEAWSSRRTGSQEIGSMVALDPHRWAVLINETLKIETDEAPDPDPATDLVINAAIVARSAETGRATVQLTVENRGIVPARDTRLTLAFPEVQPRGPDSVIATAISPNAQPATNALGGQTYKLGDLAPDARIEIIVELRGALDGRLDAAAWVGSTAGELDARNNRAAIHTDGLIPVFSLAADGVDELGQMRVKFNTVKGWKFWIDSSQTLNGPWDGITGIIGDGQPSSVALPLNDSSTHFLRLRVTAF